jgi:cell wall assembly regulator SMI1
MQAAWTAIEAALAEHAPGVGRLLRPPATAAALVNLGETLGCELPPGLSELLLVHDGSEGPVFDAQTFLSAKEIGRVHRLRTETAQKLVQIGVRSPASAEAWWQADLIPVTDAQGDGYCVDVRGGGVYYHRHDDDLRQRGDNFESWFSLLAGRFERGELAVIEGKVWLR